MSHSPTVPRTPKAPAGAPQKPDKKGLRPWMWIWLAFALQITAWVFWVKLASKHPVQEVPLVTAQPPIEYSPPGRAHSASSPGKTDLGPQTANEQPAR